MEYTILYSYWEEFYKKKKGIKEVWKDLDKCVLSLMASILISGTCAVIVNIIARLEQNETVLIGVVLPIIFTAWELVSVIALYIYIDKRDIKKTKETIKNIKVHYGQIHQWFKEMGYTRKAEIAQFGYRCEKKLEEMQNKRMEMHNIIEKMFTIFYVPAMFAIISWVLSSNNDLHDMKEYVFLVILVVSLFVVIYLIVISLCKIVETSNFSDVRKMKCLVRDINGVLDYCYDCKDEEIEFIHYKDEK